MSEFEGWDSVEVSFNYQQRIFSIVMGSYRNRHVLIFFGIIQMIEVEVDVIVFHNQITYVSVINQLLLGSDTVISK